MPTIKRTAQAEEDLIDIWLHIAHDDMRAAASSAVSPGPDCLVTSSPVMMPPPLLRKSYVTSFMSPNKGRLREIIR